MAQILKVDREGKPFTSMQIAVCKTDEEARDFFGQKKAKLLNPKSKTEDDVWGQAEGACDAFAHTFLGRKENLVFEILLFEGAGPGTTEDLNRMHQQYLAQKRELDSLIARLMKWN